MNKPFWLVGLDWGLKDIFGPDFQMYKTEGPFSGPLRKRFSSLTGTQACQVCAMVGSVDTIHLGRPSGKACYSSMHLAKETVSMNCAFDILYSILLVFCFSFYKRFPMSLQWSLKQGRENTRLSGTTLFKKYLWNLIWFQVFQMVNLFLKASNYILKGYKAFQRSYEWKYYCAWVSGARDSAYVQLIISSCICCLV